MIGRRGVLATSLGAFFGSLRPSVAAIHRGRRRITQSEFNDAIPQHARWLQNRTEGRRADFASCDLSGLDFGVDNPNQVLLRGADFTEANLSGIRGNDVNLCHASLHYTNLSGSHLKSPVFYGAILRNADGREVVWGWPERDSLLYPGPINAAETAVFMSTCLRGADFDHARVRGYFHDCSLSGASFAFADFSQSDFSGNDDDNRFAGAMLVETKFHHASVMSARFEKSIIRGADFLGARLHPRIAAHLLERDALNVRV